MEAAEKAPSVEADSNAHAAKIKIFLALTMNIMESDQGPDEMTDQSPVHRQRTETLGNQNSHVQGL